MSPPSTRRACACRGPRVQVHERLAEIVERGCGVTVECLTVNPSHLERDRDGLDILTRVMRVIGSFELGASAA